MPNVTRTAREANKVLLWVDKVLEKHLGANIVFRWVDEVLEKMLEVLVVDNVLLRRVDLSSDARKSDSLSCQKTAEQQRGWTT